MVNPVAELERMFYAIARLMDGALILVGVIYAALLIVAFWARDSED